MKIVYSVKSIPLYSMLNHYLNSTLKKICSFHIPYRLKHIRGWPMKKVLTYDRHVQKNVNIAVMKCIIILQSIYSYIIDWGWNTMIYYQLCILWKKNDLIIQTNLFPQIWFLTPVSSIIILLLIDFQIVFKPIKTWKRT